MAALKRTTPGQNIPWIDVGWLQAIRPSGQQRHNLHSNYIYFGYIALYLFAAEYADRRRVLEVGCGTGFGSYLLAHLARQVFALDLNVKDISYAERTYHKGNLHFYRANALRTGLPDNYFDLIVSIETFEHIDPSDATQYLQELRRLLTPSGTLILSTPNKEVYDKISTTADHRNEKTVTEWFEQLGGVFPFCRPYYQRKGEWEKQQRFFRMVGRDRFNLRRRLPDWLKSRFVKIWAPQRQAAIPELLQILRVHPATSLTELQDAVIQIAECRKG